MKVVILAGGLGTRLEEETVVRPKPMVEVGGRPILWHILKTYAHHGFKEFLVALGYKGEFIKRYFLDYYLVNGDLTVDMAKGANEVLKGSSDDWRVHLLDTGPATNTGGRILRLGHLLRDGPFMVTYGDGVSDIDVGALLEFHKAQGRLATVTAVRPPARFGGIVFDGDLVGEFTEKPQIGEGWINGGFMVFEPDVLEYFADDDTSLEGDVLEKLTDDNQLAAYRHDGFWQCMDTLRDKRLLENLIARGEASWQVWE